MRLQDFQRSVAGSSVEVFVLTLDGKFVWANEHANASLGASPEGLALRDIAPEAAELFEQRMRAVRAGDLRAYPTVHRTRSGERIEKEVRSLFVTLDGVEHLAAYVTDTRRHKVLEAEFHHLTQLYSLLSSVNRALLHSKTDDELFAKVCDIATEPNCFRMAWVGLAVDGRVKPVARAGAVFGYLDDLAISLDPSHPTAQGPTSVAIRTGAMDICSDIATSHRMAPWRERALLRGYLASAAVPLRRGDAVVGALMLYAAEPNFFSTRERQLLQQMGDDVSMGLTMISTRKERDELKARLEGEQRLAAIGRMAASVGHDFNNLLSVILGNAESALQSLPATAPEREELAHILDTVERSGRLTRELIARARGEKLESATIDLSTAVREIMPMLQRLAGAQVRLSHTLPTEPVRVRVSTTHLEQMLTNLVVNARDALGGAGKITLVVGVAEVDAALAARHGVAPGRFATVAVSDDGPGVPPELHASLFEPFFTTRSALGGTGLGLATVAGLSGDARGFVTIASSPGAGATFTLHFPLAA
ncbi:MAG: ATP-binding protein [Myxococcaceae bacterium]